MRALAWPRRLPELPHPALLLGVLVAALALGLLPLPAAAVLVLGLSALLLTLARLGYGLALLAFTVPFGSLGEVHMGELSLSATEFLLPLVVLAWVMRTVAAREAVLSTPWILWPLAAFMAAMALSITSSPSLGLSLKEMAKWLEFAVALVLVGSTVREKDQAVLLLGAVLAAGALAALHGWYQFILREGPGSFLVGESFLRAYGFYGQPNPFAGYLLSVAPLALALFLLRGGQGLPRRALGSALAVLVAALLMTLSRGAVLGLAGAAVLVGGLRGLLRRRFFLALLLVALLLGLALSYDLVSLPGAEEGGPLAELGIFDPRGVTVTPQNWSVVERMALWYSAWYMWQDHLWLGVGIGNFGEVYPDYALPLWSFGQEHAHNYYLNLLAEAGLLGLSTYLIFLGALFLYAARGLRAALARGWDLGAGLALALLAILLATSVHNFFDNIYVHGMLVQMGLLLGLAPYASGRGEAKP